MLDETTPADTTDNTGAESAADIAADSPAVDPAVEAKPAKKAAAKRAPAKKAAVKKAPAKKAAAKKSVAKTAAAEVPAAAEEALAVATSEPDVAEPAKKAPARRTRKAPAKKAAGDATLTTSDAVTEVGPASVVESAPEAEAEAAPAKKAAAKRAPAKKAAAKKAPAKKSAAKTAAAEIPESAAEVLADATSAPEAPLEAQSDSGTLPLFQAPEAVKKAPARRTRKRAAAAPVEEAPVEKTAIQLAEEAAEAAAAEAAAEVADEVAPVETTEERETPSPDAAEDVDGSDSEGDEEDDSDDGTPTRRRRRRGGRRRRRSGDSSGQSNDDSQDDSQDGDSESAEGSSQSEENDENTDGEESSDNSDGESSSSSSRRRRRRRRSSDNDAETPDDPENTVVRVRKARSAEDQITSLAGSTRLEAKKQRRREGREAGRRRAPIVSEAEFLARRESVERVMVVRQRKELTQIAVLEDKVLVEHYVARESQTSLIGNVYLGRVQNVLPSMEAAFIDIGKGRNAVLYAGEVNWSALGHKDGQARKIESVLSPGQPVLVQVSKDPIGHKGARLTSQISLAGRFLVYVPDGTTSGISRKLPDTERSRLKALLKEIVPDSAGVIVRTAAEGASEEELTQDVERLKARWEDIEGKGRGNAPQLLYGEPDLTLKVVRDLFTEDFTKLVIEGDEAWETVSNYVQHVAPDLADRLERYAPADNASAQQGDSFTVYRIDEQIAKGLDRKVWLPSGGSLVIDRTEAMTVVDVNTGKFTGSGGNLEETVTKNNLEAAEEIVRQLRLRDIGGIIVVDFIDMVLESNRDLVVRRMVECLGRDRTRHQVAEVTSLGLVQMTRKRIGTGLLEAFSSDCEHCQGRGVVTHAHPVEAKQGSDDDGRRGGRRGRGRGESKNDNSGGNDQGAQKSGGNDRRDGSSDASRPEKSEQRDESGNQGAQKSEQRDEGDNQRSGRRRGRGGQGNAAQKPGMTEATEAAESTGSTGSTGSAAVAAPVVEPRATEAPSAEVPATETPAAEAPVDTKPRVVTRSRRRGASRPVTQTASEVAPIVVESTTTAPTEAAAPAEVAPVAEAIRPKVVTRTRGRAASRPAGSSAGEAADASASERP